MMTCQASTMLRNKFNPQQPLISVSRELQTVLGWVPNPNTGMICWIGMFNIRGFNIRGSVLFLHTLHMLAVSCSHFQGTNAHLASVLLACDKLVTI